MITIVNRIENANGFMRYERCVGDFDKMLIDPETKIGKCKLECDCNSSWYSLKCYQKCLNSYGKRCTEVDLAIKKICMRKCEPFYSVASAICDQMCDTQCLK